MYLWHLWMPGDEAVVLLSDRDAWLFRPATLAVLWRLPLAAVVRCEGRDSILDLVADPVGARVHSNVALTLMARLLTWTWQGTCARAGGGVCVGGEAPQTMVADTDGGRLKSQRLFCPDVATRKVRAAARVVCAPRSPGRGDPHALSPAHGPRSTRPLPQRLQGRVMQAIHRWQHEEALANLRRSGMPTGGVSARGDL